MALPNAASVLSAGLGAYPTVYYDRKAIEAIQKTLFLYGVCMEKPMPNRSGVAMQIFDHSAMAANLVPATEGTPGSGQTLTQNTRTINLSQYVDYVSFSDKVVLTMINDEVTAGAELLSYRGALTVDNLVNNEIDSTANTYSAANKDVANATYMSASLSRTAAQALQGADIKHHPSTPGLYRGVIHSHAAFDLINDSATGGFIDLMKYTDANASKLQKGIGDDQFVGNVGNVAWYQSNALNTFANYASSGVTAYEAVAVGKDAIFASSLGKTRLGQKNFSVKVSKFPAGSNSLDPAGQIAAAASYNFFFGVSKRPGGTPGLYRIRVESSIG